MIVIAKRKKDTADVLLDLRKKSPFAPESDLQRMAQEKVEKSFAKIKRQYPGFTVIDLTSKSKAYIGPMRAGDTAEGGLPAVMFSPFYPHGGIPVPGCDGVTATCVEAVWQGLKVFEGEGVDFRTFANATGRNLKRTVRRLGSPLGHRYSDQLLDYYDARVNIYLPTYKFVLDNIKPVNTMAGWLRNRVSDGENFVFLDYNTNGDYRDLKSPLSHASLVRDYVMGKYPDGSQPAATYGSEPSPQPSLFPDF
ncbi:MAG: DUF6939 family protein [Marinilabiliaceae bacterium]